MAKRSESFVSGPLVPLLRASRYVGVAPLRFKKQGFGWRISLSPRFSLYGYIIATLSILTAVWSIIEKLLFERMVYTVWNVYKCVLIADVAAMAYCAPKWMRSLINTIHHMHKIHFQLKIFRKSIPRAKKIFALFVVWGIVTMFGGVITIIYYSEFFGLKITMWSLHFVLVYETGLMQFSMVVLYVRSCFASVNICLKNLLQYNTSVISLRYKSIRDIAMAYTLACKLVRDVNQNYGLMLMLSLFHILVSLINTSYYFIVELLSGESEILIIVATVFWGISDAINLVMIIEPCHLVQVEMETTRELVSRLIKRNHSVYDPVTVELERFSSKIDLNSAFFSPLDLVTVDRSLFLMIINSVATYLAVVIKIPF